MGTQIRDVVPISFQIAARAYSSSESFSIPLFIDDGTAIAQRSYTFTSLSEAVSAGFSSGNIYNFARDYFGQTSKLGRKPNILKVFRKASVIQNCIQSVVFDADASGGTFTLTIAGETTATIAYNANAAAIKSAIDALTGIGVVTVAFNTGGTQAGDKEGFTIEFSGDAGVDYALATVGIGSLTGVATATVTKTQLGLAAEDWGTGFTAAKAADNAFFFVAISAKPDVIADVDTLPGLINSDYKQLWLESDNTNIKSGTTANIASSIKALAYKNVLVIAHYTAGQYAVAAEMGATIPDLFGAVNPAYYPLQGITAGSYTSTEIGYLVTNGANRIELLGNGVCIIPTSAAATTSATQGLITGSGDFAENIWIKYYLETVVSEAVLYALQTNTKIPFTIEGFRIIQSIIAGELQTYGVNQGILEAGSIVVTMPDFDTYNGTKKAARWLDGVDADGTLQGAINKITITGYLAV